MEGTPPTVFSLLHPCSLVGFWRALTHTLYTPCTRYSLNIGQILWSVARRSREWQGDALRWQRGDRPSKLHILRSLLICVGSRSSCLARFCRSVAARPSAVSVCLDSLVVPHPTNMYANKKITTSPKPRLPRILLSAVNTCSACPECSDVSEQESPAKVSARYIEHNSLKSKSPLTCILVSHAVNNCILIVDS